MGGSSEEGKGRAEKLLGHPLSHACMPQVLLRAAAAAASAAGMAGAAGGLFNGTSHGGGGDSNGEDDSSLPPWMWMMRREAGGDGGVDSVEDLPSAPRRVQRLEVNYDRVARVVSRRMQPPRPLPFLQP